MSAQGAPSPSLATAGAARKRPASILGAIVARAESGGWVARFLIDFARFHARQLLAHRAPQMAAALSYRTIFSLIPVLVLGLVIFKTFFGEQGIKYALGNILEFTGLSGIQVPVMIEGAPGVTDPAVMGPPVESLSSRIEAFVDTTVQKLLSVNFGLITVVGLAVLIYAALSLLIQVEQAFNTICGASTGRRVIVRLTTYWTLLTLGSLAVVAGFLVGDGYSRWVETWPGWAAWAAGPINVAVRVGLTWLLLIFAYTRMPNARVRLAPAAVGGLIAAIAWELGKIAFTRFVVATANPSSGGQMAVYGSLALIPLFLLWVYVTWLIVLFGLEVGFAVQEVHSGRAALLERQRTMAFVDPAVGVVAMRMIAEGFPRGEAYDAEDVSHRCGLDQATALRALDHLTSKGLLHRVERDADIDAYALARPASMISAAQVLTAMQELSGDPQSSRGAGEAELASLRAIRSSVLSTLGSTTLADLLAPAPPAHNPGAPAEAPARLSERARLSP